MFSVLVIRLRSLRLLRVSGIVMRLRMFLLLITFLKASHSFRNRLLVICKNAYLFATMIMTSVLTGAERMPHDLSHLGFLAGQIGRLITISTTPVIAGDSFEMDAVGALRLSPLRRGLAIDSTVDIFTFYVPHRHVYGEQWIKFMKDGVNAT